MLKFSVANVSSQWEHNTSQIANMKRAFWRMKRSIADILLKIWFMTIKKKAPTLKGTREKCKQCRLSCFNWAKKCFQYFIYDIYTIVTYIHEPKWQRRPHHTTNNKASVMTTTSLYLCYHMCIQENYMYIPLWQKSHRIIACAKSE